MRLVFHGRGGELFGLFIANLFKTLLTLGIYYFWGKAKTRQYLWGQTEFHGERFAFHGTGKELLVGSMKAGLLFGGFVSLKGLAELLIEPGTVLIAIEIAFGLGFLALIALAQLGAVRYRLSRTSWRGIRFAFHGSYRTFVWLSFRGFILMLVTLGLYYPYYRVNVRRYLVSHTSYGTMSFAYDGNGRDLLGKFFLALLLTLATYALVLFILFQFAFLGNVRDIVVAIPLAALGLGILWVSYTAHQRRYLWDHTTVQAARFHCTVTGWGLVKLSAVNLLITLLTLGLATPWAVVRSIRYDLEHLELRGAVDIDSALQKVQDVEHAGEGLADLLNVDTLAG